MEDYIDILDEDFQKRDLKDLQPAVQIIYATRVKYFKELNSLLENDMVEVPGEVKPTINIDDDDEDEDEKCQEEDEEEEKKEEKEEEKQLYEIRGVYRTVEKRLSKHPRNFIANSFGFTDKIGGGVNTYIHTFYDPNLNSGTVIIKKDQAVLFILQHSLADLQEQRKAFYFQFQGVTIGAQLSANIEMQNLELWIADVPYNQIKTGNEEFEGIFRYIEEHKEEKKVRKSLFKVAHLEPGREKEVVPIEVSYNFRTKAAMIAIKTAAGEKQQRSEVVKGKRIEDAFPLNMLESNHSWKLTANLPQNLNG